jgi:hypothetical protein
MVAKLLPKDVTLEVSASQALLDALKAISKPAPSEPEEEERDEGVVGHA